MGAVLKGTAPLLVSLTAVAAVILPYLALGGASYEPAPVADPCVSREWRNPDDLQTVLEQVALSALDGAACALGVSREDLVLAVRDEASLDAFAAQHGLSRADAEEAVRHGLERAVDEAEEAGALSGFAASFARRAVRTLQPWRVLETLESLGDVLP
jgi:hypothetical protein